MLKKLELRNFRCHQNLNIDFGDNKKIVIIKENGAGKTSILEAIYYACFASSFRAKLKFDMIMHDQQSAFIRLGLQKEGDSHIVKIGFSQTEKAVWLDDKKLKSHKEISEYLKVVFLSPEDIGLIASGPENRRHFLQEIVCLLQPEKVTLLHKYRYYQTSRKAQLETATKIDSEFLAWAEKYFLVSQELQAIYQENCELLNQALRNDLKSANLDFNIELSYKKIVNLQGVVFDQFCRTNSHIFEEEIRTQKLRFGVHLEDVEIHFQGKNARNFASRGQQKFLSLLLKLAFVKSLEKQGFAEVTLFLIDDFASELDSVFRGYAKALLDSLSCQIIETRPNGILESSLFFQAQI